MKSEKELTININEMMAVAIFIMSAVFITDTSQFILHIIAGDFTWHTVVHGIVASIFAWILWDWRYGIYYFGIEIGKFVKSVFRG